MVMRKTFDDFLIDAGFVTQEQKNECQKNLEQGQRIEQCLVEKNLITPEALARAYGSYTGLKYIEKISDEMADLTLLGKIPLKFLRENVVMPVMIDGTITILTADPLQFQPLDDLNLLLGGGTKSAVATGRVIIDGINRYYPIEGTKQMIEELEEEERAGRRSILRLLKKKILLPWPLKRPIIKLVNNIFFQAVKRGASDIHIEPFEKELHGSLPY